MRTAILAAALIAPATVGALEFTEWNGESTMIDQACVMTGECHSLFLSGTVERTGSTRRFNAFVVFHGSEPGVTEKIGTRKYVVNCASKTFRVLDDEIQRLRMPVPGNIINFACHGKPLAHVRD